MKSNDRVFFDLSDGSRGYVKFDDGQLEKFMRFLTECGVDVTVERELFDVPYEGTTQVCPDQEGVAPLFMGGLKMRVGVDSLLRRIGRKQNDIR